ncbi:MAG TPA: hypothetical protein VKH34_17265 [Vicinamibacterales bacterium]|nr:hypothetical protein [Vicinamibacterales bacterium]
MRDPILDAGAGGPLSRRAFLACCSALALAGAGCAGLPARTRSAYILATDPPGAQYQPILDGLIAALLPCEHPDFPLTVAQVRSRLLGLFTLEEDPRFLDVQKALVLFDRTELFAQPLVLRTLELHARDAATRGAGADAILRRGHSVDSAAYDAFAQGADPGRFVALPLARQRAYLDMWRPSGYVIRRQFYASAKSLVMISAYSTEVVWRAIGYAGPLLDKGHA